MECDIIVYVNISLYFCCLSGTLIKSYCTEN